MGKLVKNSKATWSQIDQLMEFLAHDRIAIEADTLLFCLFVLVVSLDDHHKCHCPLADCNAKDLTPKNNSLLHVYAGSQRRTASNRRWRLLKGNGYWMWWHWTELTQLSEITANIHCEQVWKIDLSYYMQSALAVLLSLISLS